MSYTSLPRRWWAGPASAAARAARSTPCSGAILIVLIRQSIRTLHFDQNYEWIIIGCAIVIAVVLDQSSTRFAARRLARASLRREPRRRGPADATTRTARGGRSDDDTAANGRWAVAKGLTLALALVGAAGCNRSRTPAGYDRAADRRRRRGAAAPARRSRIAMIAKSSTNPVFLVGAHRRRDHGQGAVGKDRRPSRGLVADAAAGRRPDPGAADRAGGERGRERDPGLVLRRRQGHGRDQRRGRARRAGDDVRQRRAAVQALLVLRRRRPRDRPGR